MRSGQILILILLIVVVALAVGLSVASRNITNLRTTVQTEESQEAFTAAEGALEDVLSRFVAVAPASGSVDTTVPVGGIDVNVNIKALNLYEETIDPGSVGQVNLEGIIEPSETAAVDFEWTKTSDPVESADPMASIEITFVCKNPTCFGNPAAGGSEYSQHRAAFSLSNPVGESGFDACPNLLAGAEFKCKYTLTLGPSDENVVFARIRPFWNRATVKVSSSDSNFPVQTYELTSTASQPSGITRRVQVRRNALPTLPAAFDYALFSEGDIVK